MIQRLLLTLVAVSSLSATAQPTNEIYRLFPVLECPAIGDEYEKMIARIDSIKAAIKEDANCQNVTMEVKSLEDLVVTDRKAILEILNGEQEEAAQGQGQQGASQDQLTGQARTLTAEQAQQVREYAENVTKKVSAITDLFTRSNQCFKEDHAQDQLLSLSGFVSEASQMVGSMAGPWGAPIAIAGNVIAGFLTGLDGIFKSRAGFDFEKREQWMSYVQNLCTYHSYREQIDHLLNPKAQISQLKSLGTTLDQQIGLMTDACAECREIKKAYDANKGMEPDQLRAMVAQKMQTADATFPKPYGSFTLQSLGLRDWVDSEVRRIQTESNSYWGDVAGRHVLYLAKDQIEQFLIQREAPRFLQHQLHKSREDFAKFEFFAQEQGRILYDEIERLSPTAIPLKVNRRNWDDSIQYFRPLVLNIVNFESLPAGDAADDARYSWLHYRDQSLLMLRTAQTSTQVMQAFCSFFKHAGQFSPSVRQQCANEYFRELIVSENKIEQEIAVSPALIEGDRPMTINPDLEGKVVYSANKVEALMKMVQSRGIQ
jgi:hypothetical protein